MLPTICITLFIVKVTFDIFVISKYFIAVLFNVHLAPYQCILSNLQNHGK